MFFDWTKCHLVFVVCWSVILVALIPFLMWKFPAGSADGPGVEQSVEPTGDPTSESLWASIGPWRKEFSVPPPVDGNWYTIDHLQPNPSLTDLQQELQKDVAIGEWLAGHATVLNVDSDWMRGGAKLLLDFDGGEPERHLDSYGYLPTDDARHISKGDRVVVYGQIDHTGDYVSFYVFGIVWTGDGRSGEWTRDLEKHPVDGFLVPSA